MITSAVNPKIKYVRRLQAEKRFRQREQVFVVEGRRWLTELINLTYTPALVFYTQEWYANADNAQILQQLDVPAQAVSDEVMAVISDMEAPPGVLAVVPMRPLPLPAEPSLLLILDEVTNPGNLGTMLRTASAAGVDGVLLGPGCVDIHNPKVVRGGMGAHLRLPIHTVTWSQVAEIVEGMEVWLASTDGETLYTAVEWCKPSALIIGSEARGAGDEARRLANGRLVIPMHADTESLNAAIAAGIILFEAVRQRSIG